MLNIEDLHVEVDSKKILNGINLCIPGGEVHALFGPNGSGKSVMIMTIMGYPEYKITKGKITFNNTDITQLSIGGRSKLGLGICEQHPPTIRGVKLSDLLEFMTKDCGERLEDISEMKEAYQIDDYINRNINEGLSGGEIKKVELFLLMLQNPKLMILDEPDSGVDPEHLKKLGGMINGTFQNTRIGENFFKAKMYRKAGLITTHSAAILDYIHMDKAHLMLDGKIVCSGNPGIMMDQIRDQGYDYCVRCQAVNA